MDQVGVRSNASGDLTGSSYVEVGDVLAQDGRKVFLSDLGSHVLTCVDESHSRDVYCYELSDRQINVVDCQVVDSVAESRKVGGTSSAEFTNRSSELSEHNSHEREYRTSNDGGNRAHDDNDLIVGCRVTIQAEVCDLDRRCRQLAPQYLRLMLWQMCKGIIVTFVGVFLPLLFLLARLGRL